MEKTREDRLAGLRAKNMELESLEERNNALGQEINEIKTVNEPVH